MEIDLLAFPLPFTGMTRDGNEVYFDKYVVHRYYVLEGELQGDGNPRYKWTRGGRFSFLSDRDHYYDIVSVVGGNLSYEYIDLEDLYGTKQISRPL